MGKPEVHLDGQTITGFRTAKAEALLYFLAVTGRLYSREVLLIEPQHIGFQPEVDFWLDDVESAPSSRVVSGGFFAGVFCP